MEVGQSHLRSRPASTDSRLASANLSKADVAEIKQFAKGKSRMEDHTHLLLRRPLVDAFADFQRVDIDGEPDAAQLQTAWQDLDKNLAEVQMWQDECDAIDLEVSQLEVEDMSQLRLLTKAAIQREMSPEDTDLVEIAIHTLAALDALQRNLKTRQRDLDALIARLHWEVERRQCWRSYVTLKRDFDAFNTLSGRWKGPNSSPAKKPQGEASAGDNVMEMGAETELGRLISPTKDRQSLMASSSAVSPNGNGTIATQHVAFLQGEVEQIARRSHAFISERVTAAEARLDKLIELCKVPEAFLDEQDRLDDLSEAVKKKLIVVAHLSRQWRWAEKSDALSKLLSTLKIDARGLGRGEKDEKRDSSLTPVVPANVSEEGGRTEDIEMSVSEVSEMSPSSNDADSDDRNEILADNGAAPAPATIKDTNLEGPISAPLQKDNSGELDEVREALKCENDTDTMEHVHETQIDDVSFSSEDHGSSLPSLSSAESLNDVFVVPGTPSLKRVTSSSSERQIVSGARSATKRTQSGASSNDAMLSIESIAMSARRIVSDSAVLRQCQHATPSRRGNVPPQLRSTPSRLPVSTTPRAGTTPTPTSFSVHQQRSGATPVGRVASHKITSATKVDPPALRSKSSLSGIRERKLSTHGSSQHAAPLTKRGPNRYKANPKSKLDIMVGQIVNQLGIPVSITHAAAVSPPPTTSGGTRSSSSSGRGSAASSRSRDEREERRPREQWHDESGRYWVGHPDPKLCFCRVLRSKTVMVRVGGGWEELSSYIVKHFSHLAPNETLSAAASPQNSPRIRKTSTAFESLPWISSNTLLSTPKQNPEDVFGALPSSESQASISTSDSRSSLARAVRSNTTGTPTGRGDARSDVYTSPAASIPSTMFGFPLSSEGTDGLSPETTGAFWLRKEKAQQRSTSSAHHVDHCSPTRKTSSAWPDSKQANLPPLAVAAVRRVSGQRERLRALSSVK